MIRFLIHFSKARPTLMLCLFWLPTTLAQESNLSQRIDKLERTMSTAGLIDLVEQLESLQEEVRYQRGQIEQLQFELQKFTTPGVTLGAGPIVSASESEEGRPLAVDEGRRQTSPSAEESPLPVALDGPVEGEDVQSLSAVEGESIYREAFGLLKEGKYEEAIEGFNFYLSSNPNGKYSDNSQFWLGEAYYVLQNYAVAIEQYAKLIQDFPGSKKSSHAMLKIGYCYEKLGDVSKAIEILEDLGKRFPDSAAARLGRTKIDKLRPE